MALRIGLRGSNAPLAHSIFYTHLSRKVLNMFNTYSKIYTTTIYTTIQKFTKFKVNKQTFIVACFFNWPMRFPSFPCESHRAIYCAVQTTERWLWTCKARRFEERYLTRYRNHTLCSYKRLLVILLLWRK